jgi:hypothetical protein
MKDIRQSHVEEEEKKKSNVCNTKCIAQKSLGTKIVRHGLLPEPKVLADKHGDVRGNIFGRHDGGGCVYQQTT